MKEETTWNSVLNEHWRQFKLACQSMNRYDKMPEIAWREYVLYDLCKRHNEEIGREYFKFNEDKVEWISIKDRLPPSAGHYLVVAAWMGVIEKGEFDGKSKWSINHLFEPTHWMPLPDPPKSLEFDANYNFITMNEPGRVD